MSKPIIKPFKVSFSDKEKSSYLKFVKDILERGMLIPSKYNARLEKFFSNFIGVKHGVAVSSGSAALEITCRSLDLNKKEVLIPSNTNYSTAEPFIKAGALPLLYDSNLYPDFESIKKHTTKKTKALVIVHIGGYITPQIQKIKQFCKENSILLIEDASHAHGSKYKDVLAGSFGIASAFSLFATKVITTSEGGIILTNDKKIRDLSLIYRDQGKDESGIRNIFLGSSWRMSELHAALGLVQTKNLSGYLKRNNQIARYYKQTISQKIISIPFEKNAYYSGYKFIILLKKAEQKGSLKKHLLKNNIKPAKGVYDVPLHLQPVYKDLNRDSYPKAEHFAKTHLCLPIWKGLSQKEVERVVEVVNNWSVQQ